jgi:hypothetical protein
MNTILPAGSSGLGTLGLLGQLRLGFTLGLRHYPVLFLIALVVMVPISALSVAGAKSESGLLAFLFGFPVMALINPIGKAASIVAVRDSLNGGRPTFTAAYRPVLAHFGVIVACAAGWLLASMAGVGLLVVPGVIVLIGGQCLMGALVIEGRRPLDAARPSWQLVRPVFFAVLLLFILIEAVGIGADTALQRLVGGLLPETWPGLYAIALLGNVLSAPFLNATLAVLFLDRQAAQLAKDGQVEVSAADHRID